MKTRTGMLIFFLAFASISAPPPVPVFANATRECPKQALAPSGGRFLLREVNGETVCGDDGGATGHSNPLQRGCNLNPITSIKSPVNRGSSPPISPHPGGLTITLRGTDQLAENPQAQAAYIRAAEIWQDAIQATPISIVIDVDFGSTSFGSAFPDRVLGITDTQLQFLAANYAYIRSHLIAEAATAQERELYESLPEGEVPTDIGATRGIYAPSAVLRALHFLDPEAKPAAEKERLGNPPAIAINSAYAYDFNPDDGIDSDKRDFMAVVLHEIGHVLGFTSAVGYSELSSSFPAAVSVLDLFRVRPGTSSASFGTVRRVLTSGGEHVFFMGERELLLSTGRPDATGGDGRQASHWKDEGISGAFIGLMHPALKPGVAESLTENDLMAFELIGYTLRASNSSAVESVEADLQGNMLTVAGRFVRDGIGVGRAEVTMLDIQNQAVAFPLAVRLELDGAGGFSAIVANMDRYPDAARVRLALFDFDGTSYGTSIADFAARDGDGPSLKRASHKKDLLKLSGSGFAEPVWVETNGVRVAGDRISVTGSRGAKLRISGTLDELNLRAGSNRVRVGVAGRRSNLLVLRIDS